tara:strand:- start:236 stop:472 length:237 start_codon:yes stop_codon:yes gene_type:complete
LCAVEEFGIDFTESPLEQLPKAACHIQVLKLTEILEDKLQQLPHLVTYPWDHHTHSYFPKELLAAATLDFTAYLLMGD